MKRFLVSTLLIVSSLLLSLNLFSQDRLFKLEDVQNPKFYPKRAYDFKFIGNNNLYENHLNKVILYNSGDMYAIGFLRDSLGESPTIKQEVVNTNLNIEANIDKAKELKKLLDKNE